MSCRNYLLALDGSRESLSATNIALSLSEYEHAKLTAISVIDTKSIWALLECGAPGLIGSGPYVNAFEQIKASLRSISEALLSSFETRAQASQTAPECTIVEGDPVHEIFERSSNYNLIITGRRHNLHGHSKNGSYYRSSLTKRLAAVCACPLLIVASEKNIQKARLIVDVATFNAELMAEFCSLAKSAKLLPEIFCVGEDLNVDNLVRGVKKVVDSTVKVLCSDGTDGDEPFAVAVDVSADTVLVIPTAQTLEGRVTSGGMLVHDLFGITSPASILLLPPGFAKSNMRENEKELSASK
ncbi:MAG: universal stress protein [Candidatus Obscuribacterales bacterium]|nr:universal stress protein [Candidatus Obscuribacterales bacterium]